MSTFVFVTPHFTVPGNGDGAAPPGARRVPCRDTRGFAGARAAPRARACAGPTATRSRLQVSITLPASPPSASSSFASLLRGRCSRKPEPELTALAADFRVLPPRVRGEVRAVVSQSQPSRRSPGPGLQPRLALGLLALFGGHGARAYCVLAPCCARRRGALSGAAGAEREETRSSAWSSGKASWRKWHDPPPGGPVEGRQGCPRRKLHASGGGAVAVYRALKGCVLRRWGRGGPERSKDLLGAVPQAPAQEEHRCKERAGRVHPGQPLGSACLGRRLWGQRGEGPGKVTGTLNAKARAQHPSCRRGHHRRSRGISLARPVCVFCKGTRQTRGSRMGGGGTTESPGVTAGGASCPGWSRGPVRGPRGGRSERQRTGALGIGPREAPGCAAQECGCGQLASDCLVRPHAQLLLGKRRAGTTRDRHGGSDPRPSPAPPRTLSAPGPHPPPREAPLRGHLSLCPPCTSVF